MPPLDTITCPICGAVSHNPRDVVERYCGRCHEFIDNGYPPGVWEQDGEVHFDVVAILKAHGVENPTADQIDAAAEWLASAAAELHAQNVEVRE
jgi:hypothetical protein